MLLTVPLNLRFWLLFESNIAKGCHLIALALFSEKIGLVTSIIICILA